MCELCKGPVLRLFPPLGSDPYAAELPTLHPSALARGLSVEKLAALIASPISIVDHIAMSSVAPVMVFG